MLEKLLDTLSSLLDIAYPAFIGKRGLTLFITLLTILFILYLTA